MDAPKIYPATAVTKTSFTGNWENNGYGYFVDVATDKDFTNILPSYSNVYTNNNYLNITGLTDRTYYYIRVRAEERLDNGTAESGTTTSLTDSDKSWATDEHIGRYIRITSGTGAGQYKEITANTADTVTASFDTAPDNTSVYEIVSAPSANSLSQEVLTGFHFYAVTFESKDLLNDFVNFQGMSIEVATDFNFVMTVRDKNGTFIKDVDILITLKGWNNKGAWNPNTDPEPVNPVNDDFYTISADGTSNITGEDEYFTTEDLLLRYNDTWQRKVKRHVNTDDNGIAIANIDYQVNNIVTLTKTGYQIEMQTINRISGKHQYDIIMYPVITVITTSKGYAVNLNPKERISKDYQ